VKVIKWLIFIFVFFYYVLYNTPPEWISWVSNTLKFNLFLQSGSIVSFLATVFFVILICIASVPILIALLAAEANKRKDYVYGSIIIITAIFSAWEIWVRRGYSELILLIFDPFSF
jgi:hypothetical protein